MQIKPIIAAAGALACLLPGYAAIAAGAPEPSGAALTNDDHTARSGEIVLLAAMADEKAGMKTGQARRVKAEQMPQAIPAQEDTAHTENSAATVSVRNTRPKMDLHKDARACLEAANNKAVIKCANKYR